MPDKLTEIAVAASRGAPQGLELSDAEHLRGTEELAERLLAAGCAHDLRRAAGL
jgi:hypothetical protein